MKLSSIISDGMVLQRHAAVAIWGKTRSSEVVKVLFLEKTYETQADSDGNWTVTLNDLKPGGPYQMVIIDNEETTVIQDILIGDVWVLGGQSNMELPVRRTLDLFSAEMKTVNQPYIRQFAVPQLYDFHAPQQDLAGGNWIAANQTDVMSFSAAGYFFAKDLYETYGVPIGLIMTAVGGTPIEAWISEKTLREIGGYEERLAKLKDDSYVAGTKQNDEKRNHDWYEDLNERDLGLKKCWHQADYDTSEWQDFVVPNSWAGSELETVRGSVWFRTEINIPEEMLNCEAKLALGTIIDGDDTYVNGTLIGNTGYMYPPRRYQIPTGLLKPGKNSIAVRIISTQNIGGFLKDMPYKLIANGHELNLEGTWKYRIGAVTERLEPQTFFQYMPSGVYNKMISPLQNYKIKGVAWYQGESNTPQPKGYHKLFEALVNDWRKNWGMNELPFLYTQLANFDAWEKGQSNWAELREEQRKAQNINNTGMAVTIDIGEHNDLHPQDKKTLGQRLGLCAKKLAYDENIVYSGPIYQRMEKTDDAICLYFDHVGSGLTSRNGELKQFMICGEDGHFVPANAVISGHNVIVSCEQIKQPQQVRYAWSDNPAGANLYNKEGLPASPFTTE
ncbi:sialate O-acetylesterase [Anaerobacillus sp. CMMVII]|uniref:sialate O-acetylesterase n=1 Tax=Anaerobacillus sp. CMMVII TaxID=2755588 RepID=UPI0021B7D796|nr:sialate O-acetylesterase [Anaerobacillus sp. CMMVII]MCT8137641.1 sialate O-acetylesterase [Anaerobacillus sp. CMMVII]